MRLLQISLLLFFFTSCNYFTDRNPVAPRLCPLCTPAAMHFAFFDSSNQKILPDNIYVIRDGQDSLYLKDSTSWFGQGPANLIDRNCFITLGFGTYQIIVKDSSYNEIEIDSIVVKIDECGTVTQNLKIFIQRKSGLNKSTQPPSDSVIKKWEEETCV